MRYNYFRSSVPRKLWWSHFPPMTRALMIERAEASGSVKTAITFTCDSSSIANHKSRASPPSVLYRLGPDPCVLYVRDSACPCEKHDEPLTWIVPVSGR